MRYIGSTPPTSLGARKNVIRRCLSKVWAGGPHVLPLYSVAQLILTGKGNVLIRESYRYSGKLISLLLVVRRCSPRKWMIYKLYQGDSTILSQEMFAQRCCALHKPDVSYVCS
jgi:hypothetical protein